MSEINRHKFDCLSLIKDQDLLKKSCHNSSTVQGFKGEKYVEDLSIKCTVNLDKLSTETYPMPHVTATVVGGSKSY